MKKTALFKRLSAGFAAAVLLVGALTGCSGSSGESLKDEIDYATAIVTDYSHLQLRASALFSDEMFSKANIAALIIGEKASDEDLELIAQYLDLDSITVADENRTVIASYPDDEKGMSLKELPDKKDFSRIVKNISTKEMTEPVYDESTEKYKVLAGVKRTDGTGAVIIELSTDEYAEVCGDNLAEKCGHNTVVLKDGVVISATLEGAAKGDSLSNIRVTDEDLTKDSFSIKVGPDEFLCKAAQAAEYTVICAEPV